MARILFLPLFLIFLALVVVLVLKVKSMFTLSKSTDITLSRPSPFGGDAGELAGAMLKSLDELGDAEYQSEIHVNYKKITAFSRIGSQSGLCRITGGQASLEITRENGVIAVKDSRSTQQIAGDGRWVDFWFGVSPLGRVLDLFREEGLKVAAGSMGSYTQRNYIEMIILSPSVPPGANHSFELCAPHLGKVYGKNLSHPGLGIRNFMMRILVNSLTSLPDYIEIKYNVFRDGEFVCDVLQNSRLLY